MDESRFDRVAKAVGRGTARRQLLAGLVGAALAGSLGRDTATAKGKRQHQRRHRVRAQQDDNNRGHAVCAQFCANLPPGDARGHCVADCARGQGLYRACGGDVHRLCVAGSGDATCCAIGQSCQSGACACPSGSALCASTQSCVSTFCNARRTYNASSCQCECEPQYEATPAGGCGAPCRTDADCGAFGHCSLTPEGQGFCRCGTLVNCTNCTTSFDCSNGCFAINVVCDKGDRGCTVVC